jgi:hypothetical protein
VADKVAEAYVECADTTRDEYLYYILAKHPGRTIVFVNAVSALRRVAAVLKLLGLPTHSLHAQQQQRQRLKVGGAWPGRPARQGEGHCIAQGGGGRGSCGQPAASLLSCLPACLG